MQRFWIHSRSSTSVIFRLGIILFLVACGLLVQRLGQQLWRQPNISQAEFVERLRAVGVEAVTINRVIAPLTIPGEQVQLSGGPLPQPVEIDVYEDVDNIVHIHNNIIVSQAIGDAHQWQPRGRVGAPSVQSTSTTINVSQWPVPLHVFRQESLIVLYPGNDPIVLDVLTDIVGPPVAGPVK